MSLTRLLVLLDSLVSILQGQMGDDLMTAKLGLLGHIPMKKPQHAPMTWQHCRPGLHSQISSMFPDP